jgi:hypothetical protein
LALALTEEDRLTVFENRALTNTSGPKVDEMTGEWITPPQRELHNLHSYPDILRGLNQEGSEWRRIGHIRENR